MTRQIRTEWLPLIGSLVDLDLALWFVVGVNVDPEAIYRMTFWSDAPELRPQSWLVTLRPATDDEEAEWAESMKRLQPPPPKPWWQRVFA